MTNNSEDTPKILIIDDDELSGLLAVTYLKNSYTATFLKDPESALSSLVKNNYKVVLLDLDLGGGLRGEDMLLKIRDLPSCQHIPVVALTGYSGNDEMQRVLKSGFNAYLSKPYSKADLLAVIDKLSKKT
ncbi:MAG: response regulator [Bacteroidales bacterium]